MDSNALGNRCMNGASNCTATTIAAVQEQASDCTGCLSKNLKLWFILNSENALLRAKPIFVVTAIFKRKKFCQLVTGHRNKLTKNKVFRLYIHISIMIGDQAHYQMMSQSPQIPRSVCAPCNFVRGMSKLCKLAEIILFIPGQKCKIYRQTGRTTEFAAWQ